jgi:HEPN domain-containing protein
MKKADIENVRSVLKQLTDAVDTSGSKIEVLLDRLATALIPFAKKPPRNKDLERVLASLEVAPKISSKLDDIYEELQGAIESRSYGDEDEQDDEETLDYLLEDFAECLKEQIAIWENECEE